MPRNQQTRRLLHFAMLTAFVVAGWPGQRAAGEAPRQLLIASDIHFNPFADPLLVPDLAVAPASQWEGILNRSTQTVFSHAGEDTNWPLLQSALNNMQATLPHPALVVVAGDLVAHGFPQKFAAATHDDDRQHYRAFVLTTVAFLAAELRQHFPGIQVVVTPGNNDDECGDYDIRADGAFLSDTAPLARQLAQAGGAMAKEWRALGSYTLRPRGLRGIRILSINTVFFSNKYQATNFAQACSAVDSNAADRTFAWMETSLAKARAAHQKVWLIFHIPPGIDGYATMVKYRQLSQGGETPPQVCQDAIVPMWKPAWTTRFERILEDYQGSITASFAGHDHTDDFRLLRGGFVLIDPPISPIYGQNPSFRIVSFRKDGSLSDQSTYYLAQANPARWTLEYAFTTEWQSPRLDAASMQAIGQRIADDPQATGQWVKLLNVSSSVSVPSAAVKTLDCAITALDPATYQTCYCPR